MSERYKLTEFGKVPESWNILHLGELVDFRGRIGWKGYTKADLRNEGPLVIGGTQISKNNKIDLTNPTYLSEEKYAESPEIILKDDDIILVKTGNTIGKLAMVRNLGKATINPNTVILRAKTKDIFMKFLYHLMTTSDFQKQLWSFVTVGAQPSVNQAQMKSMKLISPSAEEQQKIAEILSTVDEKIEIIEEQINQTTDLKKGLMQRLLTKGIGHTQFRASPLGEIPEKWEVQQLLDAGIEIIDGDRGTNYPKQDDFLKDGYCLFLNAKNVTKEGFKFEECQFISQEKDRQLRKGKLLRNDIVLTTRGSVGNIALFDENVPFENVRLNSGMVIIRDSSNNYNKKFLFQFLKSQLFKSQVDNIAFGSAQPQLTIKELKKARIIIAPITEQRKIASILTNVDEKLKVLQEKQENYYKLKKGLMQQLLTGKLRVNHLINTEVFA